MGKTVIDTPTRDGVSASLDALSNITGVILLRTATGWSVLEPGTAGQVLTSNGPGQLPTWQAGGGIAFLPETTALVDAMTVTPSLARQVAINTCIQALMDGDVWDACDGIYIFAAHDEQAARLNWKDPATDTLIRQGACPFTRNKGWSGTAAAHYIEHPRNLDSFPQFAQNDAHISIRNLAENFGGQVITCEAVTPTLSHQLNPRNAGGIANYKLCDATLGGPANASAIGHYIMNRNNAATREIYKDGALLGSTAQASTALAARHLTVIYNAGGVPGLYIAASLTIGLALDAARRTALYQAELAYMQEVGAA